MKRTIYSLVILIFLVSCQSEPIIPMPVIDAEIHEKDWNNIIKISTVEIHQDKLHPFVLLNIENTGNQKWKFTPVGDVYLFRLEKNNWEKVAEKPKEFGQDTKNSIFTLNPSELILEPKNENNKSSILMPISPEIGRANKSYLRIIIVFHQIINGEISNNLAVSYVDTDYLP